MVENPYPIPRQLRQSGILLGDGGDTYGPFDFEIFDTDDVVVCWRPIGAKRFVEVAGVVVTKVNGNNVLNPLDYFSIKFPSTVPASTRFVVLSSRIAARDAGVMSGTRINPDALEKEFSKIATQQQELRRDLGRALMTDFGAPAMTVDPDIPDGATLMRQGDRLVEGPDVGAVEVDLEAIKDLVKNWASDIISQGSVPIYSAVVNMPPLTMPAGLVALRVNGFYAPGDGGGGLYSRAASEPSHAGKFQTADGIWWELQEVSIDARMFGARSGAALGDQALYLQRAIDYCALRGGTVVVRGQFVTGPLLVKANLIAENDGGLIRSAGSTGVWLRVTSDNVRIDGISLDGSWISARCIEIDGRSGVSILRNNAKQIGEYFVHFNGVTSLTIADNRYIGGSNGIANLMPLDDPAAMASSFVQIVNNTIKGIPGTAIHFAGKQSASNVNFGLENPLVAHSLIAGNIIADVQGNGILCQGWYCTVSSNELHTVGNIGGNQGIVCQGRFLAVADNVLRSGSGVGIDMGACFNSSVVGNIVADFAQIGIELQSCVSVTCSGNSVHACGFGVTTDQSAGINVADGYFGSGYFTSGVVISGNTVSSGAQTGKYGISVLTGCKNVIISSNNLLASGSSNPIFIATTAQVLAYANHENANEENKLILRGVAPELTARHSSGNADLVLSPQGSGQLKYNKAFPSAANPANFQAQVCIPIKDSSGSVYYIPAKYNTAW